MTGQVNDKLVIVGTVFFKMQGQRQRYIDADHSVKFKESA